MEAPPLNRRREAATVTTESRAEVRDRAALNGASDAETRYDSTFYAEAAQHLHAQGFCLCLHCLGLYCFGTKASADMLVSAVCVRMGVHPMKIAHIESSRKVGASDSPSRPT